MRKPLDPTNTPTPKEPNRHSPRSGVQKGHISLVQALGVTRIPGSCALQRVVVCLRLHHQNCGSPLGLPDTLQKQDKPILREGRSSWPNWMPRQAGFIMCVATPPTLVMSLYFAQTMPSPVCAMINGSQGRQVCPQRARVVFARQPSLPTAWGPRNC